MRPFSVCFILILSICAAWCGDAVLDDVRLKGRGPRACWVISENAEEIRWRVSPDAAQESRTPRREIISITYAFERQPGAWTQGLEARERGKFAESAELFEQLATGSREAEIVLGLMQAGASWELAGKLTEAAADLAKVADKFPDHPMAFDARYRLGMSLALNKGNTDAKTQAEAIVTKLEQDAKGRGGQQANVRAAAIRAALALAAGNDSERRRSFMRASFSPTTERETWMHFNLTMADALRAAGNGKDAVQIYERMLPALADDPANAARIRLGVGMGKIDSDPSGALVELLALDALPYGSPEHKCEARYNAGLLMWKEAQRMQKDAAVANDERLSAYLTETIATARLLLQAAAKSTTDLPAKTQAAELLKTLPAEKAEKTEKNDIEADTPKS